MGIRCNITRLDDRDAAILQVSGDLDFDERQAFESALEDLLATEAAQIVVDLSRITRMSSVYIGTLVSEGNNARARGQALSISIPEQIAKICRESGLDKVTKIVISKG